jgi:hypothetical protein
VSADGVQARAGATKVRVFVLSPKLRKVGSSWAAKLIRPASVSDPAIALETEPYTRRKPKLPPCTLTSPEGSRVGRRVTMLMVPPGSPRP